MPQRPDRDGGRDRAKRRSTDPGARARAEELHAAGMPLQMALAVAHGKLALNEALEKLARRDAVQRMMDKHDLSRALATQIVLGQASLQDVLAKRRLQHHREENRTRSVLDSLAEAGAPVTLMLHGHRRVTGRVLLTDSYMIRFQTEEGAEPEDIHKLQIKLAFVPDAYKRVRKVLKNDKTLSAQAATPIARPQDRYTCSDKRLFRYMDERVEVQATTLEGEIIRGEVAWFSRFEFGLKLKGDAEIVVFRHALGDLREV